MVLGELDSTSDERFEAALSQNKDRLYLQRASNTPRYEGFARGEVYRDAVQSLTNAIPRSSIKFNIDVVLCPFPGNAGNARNTDKSVDVK